MKQKKFKQLKSFDKRMTQCIADYEKQKQPIEINSKNDYEDLNINMKTLVINTSSTLKSKGSKTFMSLFGIIQYAESMTMKLTDRAFVHALDAVNNSAATFTKSSNNREPENDSFFYMTTERYNAEEFYEIMIDTETFRFFTAGYG